MGRPMILGLPGETYDSFADGVSRMIDEGRYCIDVLTQVAAVTKALQGVGLLLPVFLAPVVGIANVVPVMSIARQACMLGSAPRGSPKYEKNVFASSSNTGRRFL